MTSQNLSSLKRNGTVTSVGISPPSYMTSGSPITTAGTISLAFNSQAQNLMFCSPNGSSGVPGFRALVMADMPAAVGTVQSVDVSVPAYMTSSGGPVTTSGIIAIGFGNQTANLIFSGPSSGGSAAPGFRNLVPADFGTGIAANKIMAGPTTGGATAPSFRSLVPADIPAIDLLTVGNGGVAASDLTGNALKTLRVNAAATALEFASGGSGNVIGPAGSTNHNVPLYADASGQLLKDGPSGLSTAFTVLASQGSSADPAWTHGALVGNASSSVTALSAPAAPTVTPQGATGSTRYAYLVIARDANGNAIASNGATVITNGNATLNGTNYNQVVTPSVTGAASYDFILLEGPTAYSTGKIVNQAGTTYNHQGAVADGTAPILCSHRLMTLTTGSASMQEADTTNGALIQTLPDPTACAGKRFLFRGTTRAENLGTGVPLLPFGVKPASGSTIEGSSNMHLLYGANAQLGVMSDGSSDWKIWFRNDAVVADIYKRIPCAQYESTMAVLMSDGRLVTWGKNSWGQLGRGTPAGTQSFMPGEILFDLTTPPPAGAFIVDWAFSGFTLFIVLSNGWVYSTGRNDTGALGVGDTTNRVVMTRVNYFVTNDIPIKKVWVGNTVNWSSGYNADEASDGAWPSTFFYGMNGTLYAAGQNQMGQLGVGNTTNQSTPTATNITATQDIIDIQAGGFNGSVSTNNSFDTFVLRSNGTLYVAGCNAWGEFGIGNTTQQNSFVASSIASKSIIKVCFCPAINTDGGSYFISARTIVLTADGKVYGSGTQSDGGRNQTMIGDGTATARTSWTASTGSITSATIVDIEAGGSNFGRVLAKDNANNLWSWGHVYEGNQFSNTTGDDTDVSTPVQRTQLNGKVSKLVNIPSVNDGWYNGTCLITTDGYLRIAGLTTSAYALPTGVADPDFTNRVNRIPLPAVLTNGTDSIAKIWCEGRGGDAYANGGRQRIWILTSRGRLFGAGTNAFGVLQAGIYANNSTSDPFQNNGFKQIPNSLLRNM